MEQNATAITEPLLAQCQDFASNPSPYLPQPEVGLGGLGADGQLLLSQLEQLLSNDVFELESGPLPWQLFQTYLEELVMITCCASMYTVIQEYFTQCGSSPGGEELLVDP